MSVTKLTPTEFRILHQQTINASKEDGCQGLNCPINVNPCIHSE